MSRRRSRHSRAYRDHCASGSRRFRSRKSGGWGMNLYRNTRKGRIAGVAAGLADYWDIATWVVRLMWVGAFLFTGTLALWVYLAAWIMLAPRPMRRSEDGSYADDDEYAEVEVEIRFVIIESPKPDIHIPVEICHRFYRRGGLDERHLELGDVPLVVADLQNVPGRRVRGHLEVIVYHAPAPHN